MLAKNFQAIHVVKLKFMSDKWRETQTIAHTIPPNDKWHTKNALQETQMTRLFAENMRLHSSFFSIL